MSPTPDWPPPRQDPDELEDLDDDDPGDESAHSLLPSLTRTRQLDSGTLRDLRALVADWPGVAAATFRRHVADTLNDRQGF